MAHRNIAKAIDYINIDHNWFLMIMNNHEGSDLFDFIEHQPVIPEVTCHRIFSQLVDAVKYLAGKKIIHRDIKSEFKNSLKMKQDHIWSKIGRLRYLAEKLRKKMTNFRTTAL